MTRWITWRGRHLLVDNNGKIVKKENKKPEKIYDVDGKLRGYELNGNYLLKKQSFRGGYTSGWVINRRDKSTSFMLYQEYKKAVEEGWFIDDIKDYKDGLEKLQKLSRK